MSARVQSLAVLLIALTLTVGCHHGAEGPAYDRPFPLGQVSDAHWETQQTNAQASNFIFYDHEFDGKTAVLTPAGKQHLLQAAVRMPHVPFPIVVEQSVDNRNPKLDAQRRQAILDQLGRLGVEGMDARVVVAPALAPGITAMEGEAAYYRTLEDSNDGNFAGGYGRRFGGVGGLWR